MKRSNLSLNSAPGAGSIYTAKEFFINNNPDAGIVDATVFLDYYEPLSVNAKQRYNYLWELTKTSHTIIGMLSQRKDANDIDYVWIEMELPRGKAQFKVILLSDKMLDFFVKYQKAEVSIRFTLQELVNEALRIEGQPSLS